MDSTALLRATLKEPNLMWQVIKSELDSLGYVYKGNFPDEPEEEDYLESDSHTNELTIYTDETPGDDVKRIVTGMCIIANITRLRWEKNAFVAKVGQPWY